MAAGHAHASISRGIGGSERVDGVADRDRPGALDLGEHAEVDVLPRMPPVALDQPERVEVAFAGLGIARRHDAAIDGPGDAEEGVADADELAVPRVLLVRRCSP